jgi:sugar phosphate permease
MSEKESREAQHLDHDSGTLEKSRSYDGVGEVWEDDDPRMKALLRKVDARILIVLGLCYCISLLDRTNTGAALIAGMAETLRLDIGERYSIIVLVFFPTYILFQPIATVLCKKIGPRIFLPTIVLLWGVVTLSIGFVKTWNAAAALRVILGIFEAGLFPGSVFLLSTWYKRHEIATRNAAFYLIGSAASGFGGVLAYGFQQAHGRGGLEGWRFVFIFEGVLTVAVGLMAYIFIVDFPEKAKNSWKFLTEQEIQIMISRVEADRHDAITPPFHLGEYLKNALDAKIWLFALIFGSTTTISYATAFFLPVLLRGDMGFSIAASQCLVAPLYIFAAILMWTEGLISDRIKLRAPFLYFNAILSIIGLLVLAFAPQKGVRFFSCFLIVGGSNANIPFALTFQHNNIAGQWKRAFCSATLVGAGGIGGIVGSLVFRAKDAPKYKFGVWSCIFASGLVIVCVSILWVHFIFQNKKQRKGKVLEKVEGFRYTS